ncbi:MAG: spore coat U domain-containing protein [Gammaproteobacteria bacterium]
MLKFVRTLALTGAAGLLVAGNAFAGASPQTTTFLVSAQVIKSCNVTATALAFGSYDPLLGTNTTGTSTVNVQCTKTTVATIALNGGVNGTLAQRSMKDSVSSNTLNYQLYTTSGNTSVWGDGTGSTVTQSYTSTSNATVQPFTVYGTIPSGQNVTPSTSNTYQDTITVTVTF